MPVEILREAVQSYAPYLQPDGEMHDPVFGQPTQYGTPYHALCNAVLAREAGDAGKWFVRNEPYACVSCSFMYDEEYALEISHLARERGLKNGVVQDKLFLPGLRKLGRLVDGGYFSRILSVRGEFGYWVFDGYDRPAQRPSWNYRAEEGGGIILDMLCHWRYVLDNLFDEVRAVSCLGATHIPRRRDEAGEPYEATAEDAAYATFELAGGIVAHINSSCCVRVNRDELFELQVDGTQGSAVAGLRDCKTQHGENTPKAVWNPDLPDTNDYRSRWLGVPQDEDPDNAFKIQWEMYLRHVLADEPFPYDLLEGAKGVQLAELGLRSWRERRWLEIPDLEPSRIPEKEAD